MWACDPAITSPILGSYQAAGPLFLHALETFITAQCALVGDHVWPADATKPVIQDPTYDFIVVGAGSAGAVVANRLSEVASWKVLLIEAGGNPTLGTEAPQLAFNNIKTPEDWHYRTEPEAGTCRSYQEQRCTWPRGKTLGGSSSINFMAYIRGNKLDYDEWAAAGNYGWDYESVLPYFKKSEDFKGPLNEDSTIYHGTGGYLNVEKSPILPLESTFLNASSELGMTVRDDVNAENQMGVTKTYTTTKNGVRHSTARAFLTPVKERPNLDVVKNALATKILFKPSSNIVDGVIIQKAGRHITVRANKEVIVSGGTINSPQLLLLSGIGPRTQLEDLGIKVVADLPVGENLHDHVLSVLFYKSPTPESERTVDTAEEIFKHVSDFVVNQTGLLSDVSPNSVISFINTNDSTASSPDMQQIYVVFPAGSMKTLVNIFTLHNFKDEVSNYMEDVNNENTILLVFNVVLQPKSTGRIVLKSKNPNDYPLIYPNYFENDDDMRTYIRGVKQMLPLSQTVAFTEIGLEQFWPEVTTACNTFDLESDEYLECFAREFTFSLYHPTGTVKMGPDDDETAVVNPELKVRNVERLRVIDASVMPKITRGNTNAPTIMIAEKGADFIKNDWLN